MKKHRLFRLVRTGIAGVVLSFAVLLYELLKSGHAAAMDARLILLTLLLGFVAATLVEFFWIRDDEVKERLDSTLVALGRLAETQAEVSGSLKTILKNIARLQPLAKLDLNVKLNQWVSEEISRHLYMIPAGDPSRSLQVYCSYLRRALQFTGAGSSWLGIHEGGLDFFYGEEQRPQREQYIDVLNEHDGPKYRVIVESGINTEQLHDRAAVERYLDVSRGVMTYVMWRGDFDEAVDWRPGGQRSDWALYGEQIILEFNHDLNVIQFYLEERETQGLRKLLSCVQRFDHDPDRRLQPLTRKPAPNVPTR